jgi:nucleoside-diphosphate-sugar epimerase
VTKRLAAITGATGFLGRHLVQTLQDQGWVVRLLARRDPIAAGQLGRETQVIIGDLDDRAALEALCRGADVVIHAAGLVRARSAAAFTAVNAHGAHRLAQAAAAVGTPHVVLISSLAAREPQLSDYAASKRAGEDAARDVLAQRLTVVRPPAIYGPGDREIFRLFHAVARLPVLPVFNSRARIAMIHAEDAAQQIAALAAAAPAGGVLALSDARSEGYGWRELLQTAANAVGTAPKLAPAPNFLLLAGGAMGSLARLTGAAPMLTVGKARELSHPNWGINAEEQTKNVPKARFGLPEGFAQTVNWCRKVGWLAK